MTKELELRGKSQLMKRTAEAIEFQRLQTRFHGTTACNESSQSISIESVVHAQHRVILQRKDARALMTSRFYPFPDPIVSAAGSNLWVY